MHQEALKVFSIKGLAAVTWTYLSFISSKVYGYKGIQFYTIYEINRLTTLSHKL